MAEQFIGTCPRCGATVVVAKKDGLWSLAQCPGKPATWAEMAAPCGWTGGVPDFLRKPEVGR